MTEIAKLKTRERQKRRREKLDEIARAHGFATWTRLETAALEGSLSFVKIPMIEKASSITHTDRSSD